MIDYDTDIEDNILLRLDGWVIEQPPNDDDSAVTYLHLTDNKTISSDEVEKFFNLAQVEALNYLCWDVFPVNDDGNVDNRLLLPVCTWTAGLLWKKYTVTPNETLEDGNWVGSGTGNQLINEAKDSLRVWKTDNLTIW